MKRKQWLWLMVCLTLSMVGSCDNQSPNARLVDNMEVTLVQNTADGPPFLDVWATQEDGSGKLNRIYGAAFGIHIKLGNNEVSPSGIKIECHVLEHFDPLYPDNRGDLWDKPTLNGDNFGYIKAIPDGTFDDDVAVTRTNAEGEVIFLVGLGWRDTGSEADYDAKYIWPSGNTTINTVVNLKIVMPKKNGNIEQLVSIQIIRAQWADFWSVFNVSYSALDEWQPLLRTFSKYEGDVNIPEMLFQPKIYPEKKQPFEDCNDEDCDKLISSQSMDFPTSGDDWVFGATATGPCGSPVGWKQLVYNPSWWDWVWVEPCDIYPSWLDANDPNRTIEFFTDSEPLAYTFTMLLTYGPNLIAKYHPYDDIGYWNGSTMEIRSVDSNGIVISTWPVKARVNSWRPYPGVPWMWDWLGCITDFVIPISNKSEGHYLDSEGNMHLAIYCPEGAHLEAWPNTRYGDFNFDGMVNFSDYTLLIQNIGSFQDTFYNVMYDSNFDGYINFIDFVDFINYWLDERYIPGDWNRNYIVNFQDFALSKESETICENWLRGIK